MEGLGVRVTGDEIDARDAGLDHAVDGVTTTAADADDLDVWQTIFVANIHDCSSLAVRCRVRLKSSRLMAVFLPWLAERYR